MTKSHCVTCYFWNNYLFLPTSLSSMNLHSRLAAVTDRASEREGRSRQKPWHQWKPPCEKEDWDDKENWWLHSCLCTVQILPGLPLLSSPSCTPLQKSTWCAGLWEPSTPPITSSAKSWQPGMTMFLWNKQTNTFPSALLYILSVRLIITPTYGNLLHWVALKLAFAHNYAVMEPGNLCFRAEYIC